MVQRDGLLNGNGNMTKITLQDGKVVLRDGKVGTEQGCCCGGGCTTYLLGDLGGYTADYDYALELHNQLVASIGEIIAEYEANGWSDITYSWFPDENDPKWPVWQNNPGSPSSAWTTPTLTIEGKCCGTYEETYEYDPELDLYYPVKKCNPLP